jgi:hypothetical protein
VAVDEPDGTRTPSRTDLRPYIDQVQPVLGYDILLTVGTDCFESKCTYGVGI